MLCFKLRSSRSLVSWTTGDIRPQGFLPSSLPASVGYFLLASGLYIAVPFGVGAWLLRLHCSHGYPMDYRNRAVYTIAWQRWLQVIWVWHCRSSGGSISESEAQLWEAFSDTQINAHFLRTTLMPESGSFCAGDASCAPCPGAAASVLPSTISGSCSL